MKAVEILSKTKLTPIQLAEIVIYLRENACDFSLERIVNDENVRETRQIISCGYYASRFADLISDVGYDAFNEYVMYLIDNKPIEKEEDNGSDN